MMASFQVPIFLSALHVEDDVDGPPVDKAKVVRNT